MTFLCRAAALVLVSLPGLLLHPSLCAAQQNAPATTAPVTQYVNPPVSLLSLDALSFLEGTWAANSMDGKQQLGTYTWARELNGHILARHGSATAACTAGDKTCGHNDLLDIYQDSAGAPLQAIYFDNEGHVIRYQISTRHEELPAGAAHRDFAMFLSEASALGPRFRLSYERNTDTQTGTTILSGRFEVLLPKNEWRVYSEWSGKKL